MAYEPHINTRKKEQKMTFCCHNMSTGEKVFGWLVWLAKKCSHVSDDYCTNLFSRFVFPSYAKLDNKKITSDDFR